MAVVVGHAWLVNLEIRLSVKTLREDGHDEDVDEEGDEERDGGLDEVVLVGLANGRRVSPIDVARFDEGRVQVEVVGHDHGPDDTHGLEDLAVAASWAPGYQHPLDYLALWNELWWISDFKRKSYKVVNKYYLVLHMQIFDFTSTETYI